MLKTHCSNNTNGPWDRSCGTHVVVRVVDDILDFIATEEDTDNVVDHQMGNRAHDMWDDVTMGTFKPWMISPLGHDMH